MQEVPKHKRPWEPPRPTTSDKATPTVTLPGLPLLSQGIRISHPMGVCHSWNSPLSRCWVCGTRKGQVAMEQDPVLLLQQEMGFDP